MHIKSTYLLGILLLLIPLATIAQRNNFRSYTAEDGLTQSTVYTIIQDSRGYLWLGTEGGGINKFDGLNFVEYNKKNGLGGNIVRAIMEDSRGNIWIGTEAGLTVYDGVVFKSYTSEDGLPEGAIMCFQETENNIVWAGSAGGGLARIETITEDSLSIKLYTSYDGLSGDFIFDIYEDKQKKLWLGTFAGGICIIEPEGDSMKVLRTIRKYDGIPSDVILTIAEDHDENLWFGTYNAGAFQLITHGPDSGKINSYNLINGINDNRVWSIVIDFEGTVWFGTDEGGINKLQDSKFSAFTKDHGLPTNQILCVFEDNTGIIWAGTLGSGLVKLNGNHFSHYTVEEGLSHHQVSDIVQDNMGNYWLSSWGGLTRLSFINGEPVTEIYTTMDGLIDNSIKSMSLAPDGKIWLATDKGISNFNPAEIKPNTGDEPVTQYFTNFSTDQGLIDNTVNSIYVDFDGRVWCGTRGGISMLMDETEFVNINENQDLINNEVQAVMQDSRGNIWFATLGGIASTDRRSMTGYDYEEGLYEKLIYCLAEDVKGNIWIGSFGGGIFKLDIHTQDSMPISFIVDDSLLSSNNIYSMIFQDENTLIVGTEKGFDKLYLDDNQNILKVKSYSSSDGFIGVENNQNAIYKDNNSNIWFGTVKGVTRYSPLIERVNNEPPRTHITSLKLFFEKVDWVSKWDSVIAWFDLPGKLVLPYSSNHLTFQYTGISLSNPNKVFYKFRLDGLESAWSPQRKEVEAIYSGLTPGEYTFNVKSVNENGIWNTEPTTFSFIISPPFWQTWWFYMLCAFVSVVGIIGFVKAREKSLMREKAILEHKVRERTKELAEKNKEITDSINYAQNIQRAILPSIKSIEKGFEDSFVLFNPRDIVSGDFYWYAELNGLRYLAACDCTGHGVPGAFVSMIGNNLLNQIILEKNIERPGEILSHLNRGVKFAFTQEGEQEAQDGMDMVLCVLDKKKETLEYSGANNPLIFIRDGELEVLKNDRKPIGGDTAYDFAYETKTVKLKPNDHFYLFSDGYPDQFGGKKGKKFMMKRYKEMIFAHHQKPMAEQLEVYRKELFDWMGTEHEQIDDILVIGVKV